MNIDTDTQHAFTRPVVDHMFTRYDQVLKIDGEVGNKTAYDPTRRYSSSQTVGGLTHPTSTGAESDEDIATRSAVAPVPSARGQSAGRMAGGVGTGERSRHASSTLIAVLPHRERDRLS